MLVTQLCPTLWPHGLQPASLLCLWDFPGKNFGVCSHSLLQWICLTEGSNLGLLHCWWILYHLSPQGTPKHQEKTIFNKRGQRKLRENCGSIEIVIQIPFFKETYNILIFCWESISMFYSEGLGFPGSTVVKNIHLPIQEMQEMQVQSLGLEDSLE